MRVRLTFEPTVVPAHEEAERRLKGQLEELASEHDRRIVVGVMPPRRRFISKRGTREYYARLVGMVEEALTTGADWLDEGDGITSVQVLGSGVFPAGERVSLVLSYGDNPLVGAQVAAGLEDVLRSKLTGQLAVAKRSGYSVMLLIDQVQDPASRQPSMFLASVETVTVVVQSILREHPGVVNAVWFRDRTGGFTNMTLSPS